MGTIQACLQRDPRKRALIRGENGLLSMPFLSIDAMRCSRNESRGEMKRQDVLQNEDTDDCISVSKDKVRLFAFTYTAIYLFTR